MNKRILLIFFALSILSEPLFAQFHFNYRRLVPGGIFRNPVFWSPFNPVNQPPILGPGGNNDRAIFDLGHSALNVYTISDVDGGNDQLIIENDAVALEIENYALHSDGYFGEAGIVVGLDVGDDGYLVLSGTGMLQNYRSMLAHEVNSTGHVVVDGNSLTWQNFADITVGYSGNATVEIQNGVMTSQGSAVAYFPESTSLVEVVGPTASWLEGDSMFVGFFGDGSLEITDGASVSAETAIVADMTGSFGSAFVTGKCSTFEINETLLLGGEGSASLFVGEQGALTCGDSVWASDASSNVQAIIDNASWVNTGGFDLADEGSAGLTVRRGASVVTGGNVTVARLPGSSGIANIVDANSTWTIGNRLAIGGRLDPQQASGGQAIVTVESDGVLEVANETVIFANAIFNLNGGEFFSQTVSFSGGGQFNMTDGRLRFEIWNGSLDCDGGTVSPGSADDVAGTMQINGLFFPGDESILDIEIGGPISGSDFDFIQSVGDTFLDGELRIDLINNFVPSNQQQFVVYDVSSGDLFDSFDNVLDGERLSTVDGEGSFLVTYGFGNLFPKQVILSDFQPDFVVGDTNGDGMVNLLDVAPFVEALSEGVYLSAADINMDGVLNLFDVAPFVSLLSGS